MIEGEWAKPLGKHRQHFMLTPKDARIAVRRTACGQQMFIPPKPEAIGKRCTVCERLASQAGATHDKT